MLGDEGRMVFENLDGSLALVANKLNRPVNGAGVK